jgi:hypothetical protein
VSDFTISKVELKVIYDLLAQSPVKSDLTEFLIWCKNACESQSSSTGAVLNLEEVGQFYSDLISSGDLDVKTMPLVGFEFLQHYFISVNENQSKLLKTKSEKPVKNHMSSGAAWKSHFLMKNDDVKIKDDGEPNFKIVIKPSQLDCSDLIWTVVLNSEVEEVIPKAIGFLIKTHICLDEGLHDEAPTIIQDLIQKCMKLLQEDNQSSKLVKRVLLILKSIIKESEKRGTGGVQPHNAILKGELLDRIIIKNYTMQKA